MIIKPEDCQVDVASFGQFGENKRFKITHKPTGVFVEGMLVKQDEKDFSFKLYQKLEAKVLGIS